MKQDPDVGGHCHRHPRWLPQLHPRQRRTTRAVAGWQGRSSLLYIIRALPRQHFPGCRGRSPRAYPRPGSHCGSPCCLRRTLPSRQQGRSLAPRLLPRRGSFGCPTFQRAFLPWGHPATKPGLAHPRKSSDCGGQPCQTGFSPWACLITMTKLAGPPGCGGCACRPCPRRRWRLSQTTAAVSSRRGSAPRMPVAHGCAWKSPRTMMNQTGHGGQVGETTAAVIATRRRVGRQLPAGGGMLVSDDGAPAWCGRAASRPSPEKDIVNWNRRT